MVSLMAVVALAPLAGEETDAATITYSWYGAGQNANGQMGNGSTTSISTFTEIFSAYEISEMFAIANATYYISEGKLYGSGSDYAGQMGNSQSGSGNYVTSPVQIGSELGTIEKVAAANGVLYFITSDGKLYGCGSNTYGQMANGQSGSGNYVTSPVQIGSELGTIEKVACTNNNVFFITTDGDLYGCGRNSQNQLGSGSSNVTSPVQIGSSLGKVVDCKCGSDVIYFLTEDGKLYGQGYNLRGNLGTGDTNNQSSPVQIGNGLNIAKFAVAGLTIYILTEDGDLYGCGNNEYGQMINGSQGQNASVTTITQLATTYSPITEIFAGEYNICFISDGKLYGGGSNSNDKLSGGASTNYITSPIQIGADWAGINDVIIASNILYLTSDGKLYAGGTDTYGETGGSTGINQIGSTLGTISKAYCGSNFTYFRVDNVSYDVSITSSNSDYGSVSAAAASVPAGTTITASSNTITLGTSPDATVITATPTAADAQYTYTFDSWTGVPAGGTVTEDLTITANFTRTVNEYTITWIIGEDTDTTTVAYGELPTYPDPTPPEGYYFAGWSPEIVPVTGAATYTALFSNMVVTLDPGKGTLPGPTTIEVVQGQPIGDLPTPTPKAGYTFTGWFDSDNNEVTSETIVTETESFTIYAQYELDDSLKPVKAMTDLLPLIFVVGIIILMIGTAFYYYRP